MKPPLFVRPLTADERRALEAGLRSSDAFTLRRCQIVLASARREPPLAIARALACDDQTVRNAIHAFNDRGLAALHKGSSRPQTLHAAFAPPAAERLRELLHRSPRGFGQPTATLARLGVRWQRAKHWLTSPDPRYAAKKGGATG